MQSSTAETNVESNQSAKARILDCALTLFAQKGYDGASTREIAEAAGVNHALIKYHYGSKERLWQSAVDRLFERLDGLMDQYRSAASTVADPVERFRMLVEGYVRYCAQHPEHARIMSRESTVASPRLQWMVNKHIATSRDELDTLFEALFEAGVLPRMSMMSMRYMFTAACQNLFTLAPEVDLLFGVNVTHESQIKRHTEAVLALFLRQ